MKLEFLALAIAKVNGGFDDPNSKAFKLRNPGLLKTYRPEKKVDSENFRIFTTFSGGFKALISDLQIKCSGKNHRLSPENSLRDMLNLFTGLGNEVVIRKIVLFLQRALNDDSIYAGTKLSWFLEDKNGN